MSWTRVDNEAPAEQMAISRQTFTEARANAGSPQLSDDTDSGLLSMAGVPVLCFGQSCERHNGLHRQGGKRSGQI